MFIYVVCTLFSSFKLSQTNTFLIVRERERERVKTGLLFEKRKNSVWTCSVAHVGWPIVISVPVIFKVYVSHLPQICDACKCFSQDFLSRGDPESEIEFTMFFCMFMHFFYKKPI